MSENYVIKVDKLKGYQNTLKGEYTNFTNGVRNPFLGGYFYDTSDQAIKTMRDNIEAYLNKIDSGYNKIDSWLGKYIEEYTNLENSLKNGRVSGITDHDTNFLLSKIVDKNNVTIKEPTNIIYNLKQKDNKTERAAKYDTSKFDRNNLRLDSIGEIFTAINNGDADIVLDYMYGEHADEYLEISSNLNYYEEYQKTLDSEVKSLEAELNEYIEYKSVSSYGMTISGGGVGGIISGESERIEKGHKEIQAVNDLIAEKNKIDEQFNEILKDRASNDKDIQAVLSNQSATYEDLYKVLSEKAKTDSDLNNVLTKKTETDEKFNHLTSTQMKYYLYLSKQAELAAVNKKIIDFRYIL